MQNYADAAGPSSVHDTRPELRAAVKQYLGSFIPADSFDRMDNLALAKKFVDTLNEHWQNSPFQESEYWAGAVNAAGNLLRHAAYQKELSYTDRHFDFGSVVTRDTFSRLEDLHGQIARIPSNAVAMHNLDQWARETDLPNQRASNSRHIATTHSNTVAMENLERWARETDRPNQRAGNSRHSEDMPGSSGKRWDRPL